MEAPVREKFRDFERAHVAVIQLFPEESTLTVNGRGIGRVTLAEDPPISLRYCRMQNS